MREGEGKFYLDKQNGKLFGVCAGLADFTGISAIWYRVGLVVISLATGTLPFLLLAYFIVALIVPKKPLHLYREDYSRIFGDEPEFEKTRKKD